MTCTKCGQDNPVEARFCGACGVALVAATAVPTPRRSALALPLRRVQYGWGKRGPSLIGLPQGLPLASLYLPS